MFGMLIVNFLGNYDVSPKLLKHSHDYCSYADTIMPQFLFAAGFAMRLSLGKRLQAGGHMPWGRAIRRISGLAGIAVIWYSICSFDEIVDGFQSWPSSEVWLFLFKRQWMQTLLHIALTSLWILPVIVATGRIRIAWAVSSGVLHLVLSWWFNFEWVNAAPTGIDGGPLGFLSWSIPAVAGTVACDAVRRPEALPIVRLSVSGLLLMVTAWGMSCATTLYNVPDDRVEMMKEQKLAPDPVLPATERFHNWDRTFAEPPFVPPPGQNQRKWNYWMMSQRCGTVSYTTFAAGLSMLALTVFWQICDRWGLQSRFFRTLGTNSLAAYILHDIASWWISPWFPEDSSLFVAICGFGCFTGFVYLSCRLLEMKGWYIRV